MNLEPSYLNGILLLSSISLSILFYKASYYLRSLKNNLDKVELTIFQAFLGAILPSILMLIIGTVKHYDITLTFTLMLSLSVMMLCAIHDLHNKTMPVSSIILTALTVISIKFYSSTDLAVTLHTILLSMTVPFFVYGCMKVLEYVKRDATPTLEELPEETNEFKYIKGKLMTKLGSISTWCNVEKENIDITTPDLRVKKIEKGVVIRTNGSTTTLPFVNKSEEHTPLSFPIRHFVEIKRNKKGKLIIKMCYETEWNVLRNCINIGNKKMTMYGPQYNIHANMKNVQFVANNGQKSLNMTVEHQSDTEFSYTGEVASFSYPLQAMGRADLWLLLLISCNISFYGSMVALLIACVASILLYMTMPKSREFAFGPYLALGYGTVVLLIPNFLL